MCGYSVCGSSGHVCVLGNVIILADLTLSVTQDVYSLVVTFAIYIIQGLSHNTTAIHDRGFSVAHS